MPWMAKADLVPYWLPSCLHGPFLRRLGNGDYLATDPDVRRPAQIGGVPPAAAIWNRVSPSQIVTIDENR